MTLGKRLGAVLRHVLARARRSQQRGGALGGFVFNALFGTDDRPVVGNKA